jgi:hypothetical protein
MVLHHLKHGVQGISVVEYVPDTKLLEHGKFKVNITVRTDFLLLRRRQMYFVQLKSNFSSYSPHSVADT